MRIRKLTEHDLPALVRLCADHAQYEKTTYSGQSKLADLRKHFFSSKPSAHCLVVEDTANQLVGYATFMKQFSTWEAEFYLYLDCLYLDSAVRGMGLGRQLIEHICQFASRHGCSRLQWQTPSFNERAVLFYQGIGASYTNKKRFFLDIE